jgi:hypothetical protein
MYTSTDYRQCLLVVDAILAAGLLPPAVLDTAQQIRAELAALVDNPGLPVEHEAARTRLRFLASRLYDDVDADTEVDQEAQAAVWKAATGDALLAQATAWNVVEPEARTALLGPLNVSFDIHAQALSRATLTCTYDMYLRMTVVVGAREQIGGPPLPEWLLNRLPRLIDTDRCGYAESAHFGAYPWAPTPPSAAQWEIVHQLYRDGVELTEAYVAATRLAP